MANQPESTVYEAGIYQLEITDPVQGGLGGVSNTPLLQLANRTNYLKSQTDALNTQVSTNTTDIGTLQTQADAIQSALPAHLRHTILAGCVSTLTGQENALKIIDSATRTLGMNDGAVNQVGGPLTLAFSNGYTTTGIIQSVDYIKYLPSASLPNFTLPSTAGTYFVFFKYNTGTGNVTGDYANGENPYYITPIQPTVSEVRAVWYNPREGKHYFTTNTGSTWTETVLVPIGTSVVDGAAEITNATTFDYMQTPYDTNTPVGSVDWFAWQASTVPKGGWLLCDGSVVDILRYPRLYKRIGTTYNTGGEAGTEFRLPDLRGEFIRGLDLGRGVDSGRVLGTAQADDFEAHTHALSPVEVQSGTGEIVADNAIISPTDATGSTGGTETRPRNIAMVGYIKY